MSMNKVNGTKKQIKKKHEMAACDFSFFSLIIFKEDYSIFKKDYSNYCEF